MLVDFTVIGKTCYGHARVKDDMIALDEDFNGLYYFAKWR